MIKKDKRGIATNKLLTLILVALVVVIVLVFLYKLGLLKTLRNILPGFGGDEDVNGGVGDNGESGGDKCVKDAFWADVHQNRISRGGEVESGRVFLVLDIGDIEKCNGEYKFFIQKNIVEGDSIIPFTRDSLRNWIMMNDLYYWEYDVRDKEYDIEKGEYSFMIKGPDQTFDGYLIRVD